jgi:NAD+ synthase
MSLSDRIAVWMRSQASVAGARGLVVGLSGGIDSAVVARLCQMAVGDSALAVILPCHSDPQDERDAHLVADHYGLRAVRIDLEAPYEGLVEALREGTTSLSGGGSDLLRQPGDSAARLPLANIKPRLRMVSLYYVASLSNSLVVGTGNRSESAIGYFTKHGDGGVDLLPLGNLLKSEVRALAEELDVPRLVRDKPPSAGLWLGQTDESEMGFSYAELEAYLQHGAEDTTPAVAMKIERLMRASEHKRRLPPTYEE